MPRASTRIEGRLTDLNKGLSDAESLGEQFHVGHSYVTPTKKVPDVRAWFRQVVETDIGPLLEEYWFDAPDKAKEAKKRLLEGF